MQKYLFILLVICAIIAGCQTQNQSLVTDVEIPVSVQDVKLRSIEEFINTTGTVYPKGEIELKSKIPATYWLDNNPRTGKPWQLGDKVKTGDLIVRLEDKEFINSIKLDAQQLNLELMQSELTKQESLYEKGGVTLNMLKTASVNLTNAKYNLENAQLQMEKTRIVAPIDGFIVELPYHTQGTVIDAGLQMVKVMDYQTMFLEVQLPEKNISELKINQEVRLTNYTIPDDTIKGRITQMSPAIDPTTRTFQSIIMADNSNLLLRPGMFVKADIVTERKDSVVVISKSEILSRQKGKTVFVVENGIALERVITTGLENNTEYEVVSGLSKNERIVTSGFETLGNRSKVKIIK
jgi:membrane fusion protein (multidrug efflux system)